MRINASNNNTVVVDGQQIEDVGCFDYLEEKITKYGGAADDIKSHRGKAGEAFNKLVKIWKSGPLGKKNRDHDLQAQG